MESGLKGLGNIFVAFAILNTALALAITQKIYMMEEFGGFTLVKGIISILATLVAIGSFFYIIKKARKLEFRIKHESLWALLEAEDKDWVLKACQKLKIKGSPNNYPELVHLAKMEGKEKELTSLSTNLSDALPTLRFRNDTEYKKRVYKIYEGNL